MLKKYNSFTKANALAAANGRRAAAIRNLRKDFTILFKHVVFERYIFVFELLLPELLGGRHFYSGLFYPF